MASSSFSTPIPSLVHDIFLSFRGTDTRNSFTSHLQSALIRHRFSVFRDDTNPKRGEHITSQLPTAISESRVSIVVLSQNYAASGWCLDELVKIMECMNEFNQIVLPIFYDVDPAEVRRQSGGFAKMFEKHEERFKGTPAINRVVRWKAALTKVANLSGWHLQYVANGDEAKLINLVVEEVIKRLDLLYSNVADHPVGINSRVQELRTMLKLDSDDVCIVAIWGPGGIGKTTIAKALFNGIRNKFQGSSFLADVRETSNTSHGVVKLQKQLLSDILMNDTHSWDNPHQGIDAIKKKLCHGRILLVLDDVDHVQQLKMLAINRDLFCKGSKIIITTRNKSYFSFLGVDSVYSPAELNDLESLKLFSWNAFKADQPEETYSELAQEVVTYCEGLPLALEVLGSYFSDSSKDEWKSGLEKLKKHPHGDILGKLKISFESLDKKDLELFLDLAFFFTGKKKDFTIKVLKDSDCFPEIGMRELERRCLLRVDLKNKLKMHNLLKDTAKEIVYQESVKEPGERSRLGGYEEVLHVLRNCKGTKAIEGLRLDLPKSNDEHVSEGAFANMNNLRVLHLNYLCHLRGTYITTSRNLRWLCWRGFPLTSIPDDLYMENVVAIDLQYSKLKQIWKGTKRLDKLRFLNLSHSYHLTKTPDFSGLKGLEELRLHDCTNLIEVHKSIRCLEKLVILNLANCKKLRKVPFSILMLKSLQHLNLSGYSRLNKQPGGKGPLSMFRQLLFAKPQECRPILAASIQGVSCLRTLKLVACNLLHVPSEICNLKALDFLDVRDNKFSSLPSSFNNLSRLQTLFLEDCSELISLPDLPNSIEYIGACKCGSLEPESVVSQLGKVKWVIFNNRTNFKKNLQWYKGNEFSHYLLGTEFPSYVHFQGIGSKLSFIVPSRVAKKIQGYIVFIVAFKPISFSINGIKVINKTKGLTIESSPNRIHRLKSTMWIRKHPIGFGFDMECNDEVDLVFTCEERDSDIQVDNCNIICGMSLIYEGDSTDERIEIIK